jgi:tRNA dimethylallyltransferase
MSRQVFLIAGPTASGKSAHALEIAHTTGGLIVNTDSMQVYDVLNVLTARPQADDLRRARHALYGHVDPATSYSTGHWMRDVRPLMERHPVEQPLIFVGGTGLYFHALTSGLSPMPDIAPETRERWRYRLNEEGAARLHRRLRAIDPEAAMAIRPGDGQRIVRALEVHDASGQTLTWWQNRKGDPLINAENAQKIIIEPDRAILHERINARFETMMEAGAIGEVEALLARALDTQLPAMKAIGVRQIAAWLEGTMTRDEAIARAQAATRQYAKRQLTWLRNQMGPDWRHRI